MKGHVVGRFTLLAAVLMGVAGFLALTAAPIIVSADETRAAGPFQINASFAHTPVHPEELNAVVLRITTAAGAPVTGLEQTLQLRIRVANQVSETRELAPVEGVPGSYQVSVLLPKAAAYTLHLFGTAGGQEISERFITGQNGLDKVIAKERQYPRGSGYIVAITFGSYLVGLAVFGVRALLKRRRLAGLTP